MNITVKKLINKVCAILVIMLLTISDFMFVGKTFVSYAVDTVKTNSANVDFSAYFLNSNGEKVESLEENIDKEEQYLYVDISVKNEGYFNGVITLNDNNFNIKQEKLSSDIAEISENTVKLNQINAGSTVTIKFGIEAIKEEIITESILDTKTEVKLSGQYVNSKNVEKDKYVDIEGKASVKMHWKSSEMSKAELEASLLTNSIYKVNEEEKRVVQILVNSKITDNNYPVKNTQIKLNVPENVEEVNVHTRETKATNSIIEFSKENHIYDEQNKVLTINLPNEDEKNISWNKNAQDTFIVTYVLNKDENVMDKEITVDSNIKTYDDKEFSASQNVHIDKEIDAIVSYSVKTTEDAIYKGKIYTGEDRDYTVTDKINIDYLNFAENIYLKLNEAIYMENDIEKTANIIYKQTLIDKQEFIKLFGEDGYISIKDSEGNIITNINKDSETNENGKIVVDYIDENKNIQIETSKPIAIGTLTIENTKTVKNANYSREQIKNLTKIKETITGNYNEEESSNKEYTIELKNTSSKAQLDVSTKTLSTTEKNENVKITAILLNNDESKDLYQNPEIKIALPKQVKSVSAKCKLLYGNGLELSNAEIITENGVYVIKVNLSGTQIAYNTENLEGTTIIIYANMELDKLAVNSDEEIKLNYTNEIATSFEDNGEQKSSVKIVANSGVITTNNINEYGIETIGDQGTKNVELEVSKEEKQATVDINVINNEEKAIKDITILGKFPTGEAANLGVTLTSGINILSNTQNVKVYYSDKENPTDNLEDSTNNWNENGDANTAKTYLILIDNMQVGENFKANYTIKIPGNLSYNLKAEEGYTVNYINDLTTTQKSANATTLSLTTGTGAEVTSSLKAYVGGNEITNGDTVYSGEVIRYELKIKNNGSEVAKNLNIEATIPNNTTCVQYTKGTDNSSDENDDVLNSTSDSYQEIEVQNNILTKNIETLGINEEKTLTYEVKVKEEAINNTVSSKSIINYNGTENVSEIATNETNTISNPVSKADLSMSMIMIARGSTTLHAGLSYSYNLTVTNVTDKNLSNVNVEIKTNDMYTLERVLDKDENQMNCENNVFTINSLNAGETASYEINVMSAKKDGTATISTVANNMYHSNQIQETVKATDISISMTSTNEGENVKSGEGVNYNITITNNGTEPVDYLEIKQQLSTYLDVQKVTINGENVEFDTEYQVSDDEEQQNEETNTIEESEEYNIGFNYTNILNGGETLSINVETSTDCELIHSNNIHMISLAEATTKDLTVKSEEINHILLANINPDIPDDEGGDNEDQNENPENPDQENPDEENGNNEGNQNQNENNQNTPSKQTYIVSGTAWLDTNENGQRDSGEKTLSNIKVTLLNLKTNKTSEVTTSENGFYSLTNVENGQYVAIFEYDTEKYMLTTYQAEGIEDSRNSDVEIVTMTIDGTNKQVSSTDELQVNGNSITNIDIGLVEAKTFDLKLDKTVSKVTVTNSQETKNYEYNNEDLAKVEIRAKNIDDTTVVVEYKIKVTNEGELAGYAKQIVDYKPSDLSFNSSLNPDWYQSGDYLYSSSLANEKIEAGQTKELTLVLTKNMTENNTGLVNNTAEIKEDYNARGIKDTDSTAGNKNSSEDDMGSANLIISVSTGAAISYVAITISIIAIIAGVAYTISKKILKENIKF